MIFPTIQTGDMYTATVYNIEYVIDVHSSSKNVSRTIVLDVDDIKPSGNTSNPNTNNDRHKIFVPKPGDTLRYLSDRHSFLAVSKSSKHNSIYWHRTRSRCWVESNSVEADLGVVILVAIVVVM